MRGDWVHERLGRAMPPAWGTYNRPGPQRWGSARLRGIGQDMPSIVPDTSGALPEVIPFDPSLPYTDRAGARVNQGCPDGYFAQFQPPGDHSAVHVTIPGVVSDAWVRCRLMATTTQQTIADESGQTAAQSWYNYTNTGFGAGFGDWLNKLGMIGKLALVGGALYFGSSLIGNLRRQ